jgi:predicted deacetylase
MIGAARYIVRLDDACPTMDRNRWKRIERLLDCYRIRPIVAVIPDNRDKTLELDEPDPLFWDRVRDWQARDWSVALHGYQHRYRSSFSGLVPISRKSEFAGFSLASQRKMLGQAWRIFLDEGIRPEIWVAPSHSFDRNTLRALTAETDIRTISDGLSLFPHRRYGFTWVPQQMWRLRPRPLGVWTACYHPNEMEDTDFDELERALRLNHSRCVRVQDILENIGERSTIDRLFHTIYLSLFRLKRLLV